MPQWLDDAPLVLGPSTVRDHPWKRQASSVPPIISKLTHTACTSAAHAVLDVVVGHRVRDLERPDLDVTEHLEEHTSCERASAQGALS
jgi:hypothetical protein